MHTVVVIPVDLQSLKPIWHKPLKCLIIQVRYTFLQCFPTCFLSLGFHCDQRDNPTMQSQGLNLIAPQEKRVQFIELLFYL